MEDLKKILETKKLAVAAILIILLLDIVGYFLDKSYFAPKIAEEQNRLDVLKKDESKDKKMSMTAIYAQNAENLQRLYSSISDRKDFPKLLGEILDLAASNSLSVGNVTYKPQNLKEAPKYLNYNISFSAEGKYADIKSFLSDIQKIKEFVVIESANLSNEDLYEERVKIDLKLSIYLQEKSGR